MNRKFEDYFLINKNNISEDEYRYLKAIKKVIIDHLENVGLFYDNEEREIIKENLSCPRFLTKQEATFLERDIISLSTKDYKYWSQVIYQLSHEITHCFIFCNNKNVGQKVKWIEETICESLSLYFLKYFSNNWIKCTLFKSNKHYNCFIRKYLNDILSQPGNDMLSNCKNVIELYSINAISETERENRKNEMFELYRSVSKDNIKGLIKYKDYIIENTIFLDTERYLEDFPENESVMYLCNIQKTILEKERISKIVNKELVTT